MPYIIAAIITLIISISAYFLFDSDDLTAEEIEIERLNYESSQR